MAPQTRSQKVVNTEAQGLQVVDSPKLTEFHLFPNLPTELRLKIWDWAAHDSRVVELIWDPDDNQWVGLPKSHPKPPPLFWATKESRAEYLLTHPPVGPRIYSWSGIVTRCTFHFNRQRDILYIDHSEYHDENSFEKDSIQNLAGMPGMRNLQYLAMDILDCPDFLKAENLELFPNLKLIYGISLDVGWVNWTKEGPPGEITLVERSSKHPCGLEWWSTRQTFHEHADGLVCQGCGFVRANEVKECLQVLEKRRVDLEKDEVIVPKIVLMVALRGGKGIEDLDPDWGG